MLLRRLGNKAKIADKIYKLFPKHTARIILFFGAGGDYFNMPRPKYLFANDYDSNVTLCFDVLMRRKQELYDYIEMIPYSQDFWNECKTREPQNEIERVVYFLVLSNWGYLVKPDSLRFGFSNTKEHLLKNIEKTYKDLVANSNQFFNCDFREVIPKIGFKDDDKENTLIYSDPVYLGTKNNYNTPKWTEKDVVDCFDVTFNSGMKGAMSEFDHPFILEQAKERGLNIHIIGERQNIKNRKTEILITNYIHNQHYSKMIADLKKQLELRPNTTEIRLSESKYQALIKEFGSLEKIVEALKLTKKVKIRIHLKNGMTKKVYPTYTPKHK